MVYKYFRNIQNKYTQTPGKIYANALNCIWYDSFDAKIRVYQLVLTIITDKVQGTNYNSFAKDIICRYN